MTHDAKFEWWIMAAIGLSLLVILSGANFWIAGSVLPVLLIRAYPQRYVTRPPVTAETVKIECGPDCEIWLAPEDPSTFFQDMARHTPHLRRRGQALTRGWA